MRGFSFWRWAAPTGLFAAAAAVYVRTLSPTVLDSNGGELQYAAYVLGIPHPTGYPLYLLLGKLLTFLPVRDIAFRVNLLSALGAAGAVALLYLASREVLYWVTGFRLNALKKGLGWPALAIGSLSSLAAAIVFATSSDLWQAATVAEVHGLNSFFVALVLFMLVRLLPRPEEIDDHRLDWRVAGLALAYGLSLTHHRLMIWFLPGIALFLFLRRRSLRLTRSTLWFSIALFLLPFGLYLYFPLRAAQLFDTAPRVSALWPLSGAVLRGLISPYYTGNDLGGWLNLISGRGFSGDLGAASWSQVVDRARYGFDLAWTQFGPLGAAFSLLGLAVLFRRQTALAASLMLTVVLIFAFDLQYSHGQIWYYYLPVFVVVGLWLAVGVGTALTWFWQFALRISGKNAGQAALALSLIAILLAGAFRLVDGWPHQDRSGDYQAMEYARAILGQPLQSGAVLFGCWDAVTPLRYLQFAEGWRPDLWLMHAEPSLPDVQRAVRQVLDQGGQAVLLQCGESGTYQLPFGYWVTPTYLPLPSLPEGITRSDARFGGKVSLAGYRLETNGRTVQLALYWQVIEHLDRDYKVFVHAIDPATGQRWTQEDKMPVTPYYPTSRWRNGDLLEDTYDLVLPPETPAGDYTLLVGFYAVDDGKRLPVSSTSAVEGGDALRIPAAVK